MRDEFKITLNIKRLIKYMDKVIINFPNHDRVLKDNINKVLFEILELSYLANEINDRYLYQKRIIVKIKLLDFYLRISCDRKYISYKKYVKVCNILFTILKMVYGWIRYEKV